MSRALLQRHAEFNRIYKANFLHAIPVCIIVPWLIWSKEHYFKFLKTVYHNFTWFILVYFVSYTAQKMKFSIENFFSKCDQIHWSHLLKKSLMENFIFCAVIPLAVIPLRYCKVAWKYFGSTFYFCKMPYSYHEHEEFMITWRMLSSAIFERAS